MQIAVCDDEKAYLDCLSRKIKACFKEFEIAFTISSFKFGSRTALPKSCLYKKSGDKLSIVTVSVRIYPFDIGFSDRK